MRFQSTTYRRYSNADAIFPSGRRSQERGERPTRDRTPLETLMWCEELKTILRQQRYSRGYWPANEAKERRDVEHSANNTI